MALRSMKGRLYGVRSSDDSDDRLKVMVPVVGRLAASISVGGGARNNGGWVRALEEAGGVVVWW